MDSKAKRMQTRRNRRSPLGDSVWESGNSDPLSENCETSPGRADPFRRPSNPKPILGDFGRVESFLGFIQLMRRTLFWVEGNSGIRVHIEGSLYPYDLDPLADPTRPPPRCESAQNVARIPISTWVGLVLCRLTTYQPRGFSSCHLIWLHCLNYNLSG